MDNSFLSGIHYAKFCGVLCQLVLMLHLVLMLNKLMTKILSKMEESPLTT
jgi:hypothetical protein